MSKLPQDELLSAYLDGELNAERKAQVEKLLADDPSARATLDSLREVSSAVKGLSAFKLDEDLAAGVLKIAERRMLADTPPTTVRKTSAEPAWRNVARRFLTPRAIFWSTAVTLVAIILTFHNPEENQPGPGGELAMDMKAARPAAGEMGELSAAPSFDAVSSPATAAPEDIAKSADKAPERLLFKSAKKGMIAPPGEESPAGESHIDGKLSTKEYDNESSYSASPKAALRKSREDVSREPSSHVTKKKAVGKREDSSRHLATKGGRVEPKPLAAPNMGPGGRGMGGMGGGMGGMSGDMPPLAEKEDKKNNQGQLGRKGRYNARSAKSWTDGKRAGRGMVSYGWQQTVTVRCNVDSRPAAKEALKQILLSQNIRQEKSPAYSYKDEGQKRCREKSSDLKSEPKKREATRKNRDTDTIAKKVENAKKAPAAQTPTSQITKSQTYGPLDKKTAKPDSISIETTPAQLEQVLAEIHKQSAVFGKCSIDSGPMDTQLGALGQLALPAGQQIELNRNRPNAPPRLPPTSGRQPASEPMHQQAQTAPSAAADTMPQPNFGRTENFKVVFLMQPNKPVAAASINIVSPKDASIKAKAAKPDSK